MSPTIVTIKEANVLWDRSVYHAAPKHLRMRLKCPEPAILVDEANKIVAANEAWQVQCGYGEEAIGESPKILQGALTDRAKATRFTHRAMREGRAGTSLVNYKADGSPFMHTFVADRIDFFYFTKTTRAANVRNAGTSAQLVAIGIALVLTHAFIGACSTLSSGMPHLETDAEEDGIFRWAHRPSIAWGHDGVHRAICLLYTSPSPRDS